MPLTYDEALAFLFPRTTTIKFGLATTRALLRELGDPHEVVPSIHIGGTNGKGSVSTLIASALRAGGWRVGLYTSPHLVSFRERIRVDDVPISESAMAMWTERLQPLIVERMATFFEASTAIDNLAEQRALERVGFTREGLRRSHTWIKGEWTDDLLYGLLADEWLLPGARALGSAG